MMRVLERWGNVKCVCGSDTVDLALGWLRQLHVLLAHHESAQLLQNHADTVRVLPLGQRRHSTHVHLKHVRSYYYLQSSDYTDYMNHTNQLDWSLLYSPHRWSCGRRSGWFWWRIGRAAVFPGTEVRTPPSGCISCSRRSSEDERKKSSEIRHTESQTTEMTTSFSYFFIILFFFTLQFYFYYTTFNSCNLIHVSHIFSIFSIYYSFIYYQLLFIYYYLQLIISIWHTCVF